MKSYTWFCACCASKNEGDGWQGTWSGWRVCSDDCAEQMDRKHCSYIVGKFNKETPE